MHVSNWIKIASIYLAIALIVFVLIGHDFLTLVKLVALAVALTLITGFTYPSLRGIKKGDRVMVISGILPSLLGFGRVGTALENAKVNDEIRVRLDDGKEVLGIVESYEGFFSLPKVRVLYEEKTIE